MDSVELYKKAYGLHYDTEELQEARELYQRLLMEFPSSSEAGYARSQLEHVDRALKAGPRKPKPVERTPKSVTLTTAPSLEGYRVVETIEIVGAECVLGMNFLSGMLAGVRDFVGGRSGNTQTGLRDARDRCLEELRREARGRQANAVIAVSFSYGEYSGGGKSMLMVVASGTAVWVEPISDDTVVVDEELHAEKPTR